MAYPTPRQTVNRIASADPLLALADLRRMIRSNNPLFVPLARDAMNDVRVRAFRRVRLPGAK